jgi:hypothetical protein
VYLCIFDIKKQIKYEHNLYFFIYHNKLIAKLEQENERLKEDISEIKKYSGIIPVKIAGVSSAG